MLESVMLVLGRNRATLFNIAAFYDAGLPCSIRRACVDDPAPIDGIVFDTDARSPTIANVADPSPRPLKHRPPSRYPPREVRFSFLRIRSDDGHMPPTVDVPIRRIRIDAT